jgi:hypothetical protein
MTAAIEVLPPIQPVPGLLAHCGAGLIGRQDLLGLPTPEGTATHKPMPHAEIVRALIETLGFRRLNVVQDSYAVTADGMRMFGVLSIDVEGSGVRVALGLRNSHDKRFALALTVGYRVTVCDNLAFYGDFSPVMRKHTAKAELADIIAMGVERIQRSFEPMMRRIDAWQGFDLSDNDAKLIIYSAFIERAGIELPKHLAAKVHTAYFNPPHEEFKARTKWSLENAFTEAFKDLDPIPRFQATAKLGPFLEQFH